ncbi:hypothetical protein [Spirosoma endbachense]|uniref:Uncharacterized protein n=1 Tax=Spirosoma endbachense TaxID=2666025 RepID=A0A6P1W3V1_9BACT|nr:hypothetical protein [Spirosoma endbachense]QHV98679.1 hypothetical protein GJR95_28350 [Spirosoma endbachense]
MSTDNEGRKDWAAFVDECQAEIARLEVQIDRVNQETPSNWTKVQLDRLVMQRSILERCCNLTQWEFMNLN